jgi:hypothetical protein
MGIARVQNQWTLVWSVNSDFQCVKAHILRVCINIIHEHCWIHLQLCYKIRSNSRQSINLWRETPAFWRQNMHASIIVWIETGVEVMRRLRAVACGPGRRSTRVMLGHACETLAMMYLQRGPPIAENKSTTHRTHRTHRRFFFFSRRTLESYFCRLWLLSCSGTANMLRLADIRFLIYRGNDDVNGWNHSGL